jgi:glycosyltransferase involved in cell wall biosynthesis
VDVVHGLGASALGYAVAKRHNARLPPFVLNPQGLEEFGATDPARAGLKVWAYWPLQHAVRTCARAADAVIATDHALVPVVLRHLRVEPERVPVVPNAVDFDRCRALATPDDGARLRARYGIEADVPLLVSAGRVERNKGLHVTAAALRLLAATRRDWRWAIVGDGPYRDAVQRYVRDAGVASRVIDPGAVEDAELHAWYEAADLFVHATLYEGSSLVTLEAMAHGRPVVATRAGGLPDKVRHGETGWLVDPGDAAALYGALANALDVRERWRDMGEAGRRLAMDCFSWPAVARILIDLYTTLRDKARTPSPLRERGTA